VQTPSSGSGDQMNRERYFDLVSEVYNRVLELSDDEDKLVIRDWRGTTELIVKTPDDFLKAAGAIKAHGWVPKNLLDPKRLMFSVEFDSDPKTAVLISLKDVNTWIQRYNDDGTRMPVAELAQAANTLVVNDDVPLLAKMHVLVAAEEMWLAHRNTQKQA